jgi:predicted acetyltransferase
MIELRELTVDDGHDVFEMVKEMGVPGNGFENSLFSESFGEFQEKLIQNDKMSNGIDLDPKFVPQTIYWLYVDGKPVGYGKFMHYLNESLLNHGGNIGYAIRPTERQKGYATILLKEILKKAKEKGLDRVLVTCYENNVASRKVIEANNGLLEKMKDNACFFWIGL